MINTPEKPDQPLVSVVVPTYNRTKYLPFAIRSALDQTYSNFEIIISDDASTEDVEGVIAAFNDPRIRYRRNPKNLGQALNNLAAFKEAKGAYVANLHDDDLWEPEFLAKLVPHLQAHDDVVLVFSDHYVMDEAGVIDENFTNRVELQYKRRDLAQGIHKPFYKIGLVDLSVPLTMASVFRKEAIDWDDFPAKVNSFYDRWIIYLACRTGMGAYYHPERLTRYRVHTASATSTSGIDFPRSSVTCHDRFVQDERLKSVWPALRQMRGLSYTKLGIIQLQLGHLSEARRNLLTAMKDKPNLRAAGALCLSFVPKSIGSRIAGRSRPAS
jgi:glycosyltransferase involved in cell wall biosynthesis